MAVYTSINYKQPVDAALFDEHVAEVIAPGVYKGMYVRVHNLASRTLDIRHASNGEEDKNVHRTDLYGLVFMPNGTRIKITAPQFYNASDPILNKLVIAAPDSTDRVDLVYLEYECKSVPASENPIVYGIIKGKPATAGNSPSTPNLYYDNEVSDRPDLQVIDINKIKYRRIPLAYVSVRAGTTELTDEDISNVRHVKNASELYDFVRNLIGNIRIKGWSVSQNSSTSSGWLLSPTVASGHTYASSVTVSAGNGIIDGIPCATTSAVTINNLRQPTDLTGVKGADSAVSIDSQPLTPVHLVMKLMNGTDKNIASGTRFSITADWVEGAEIITETRTFSLTRALNAGQSYLFVSDPVIRVAPLGLNFSNILTAVSGGTGAVTFSIDGVPKVYVVAAAQDNGTAAFSVMYDPGYFASIPDTYMVLGYIDYKLNSDGTGLSVFAVTSKSIYGAE